jgi:exodeoxyribonuclease VII large subunit
MANRTQRVDVAARRLIHPAARLTEQHDRLAALAARLARSWMRQATQCDAALAAARLRLLRELRAPPAQAARLAITRDSLARAARERLTREIIRHANLARSLAHLNPQGVLQRGYAIVATPQGDIVTDSAQLALGDVVAMTFARGRADARVLESEEVRR